MSYSALRMECPHCLAVDEHRVVRSEPRVQEHWSARVARFMEKNVGRNIRYRQRTKRCSRCRSEFQSIELAAPVLDILYTLIGSEEELKKQVGDLKARCEELEARVSQAIRALSPEQSIELPKRSTRTRAKSARVG
jgi:hypothetical protein